VTALSLILYVVNLYVNWRIISILFALFTVGRFRWAIAGFATWVAVQTHTPF
jgi:hypothetical protein